MSYIDNNLLPDEKIIFRTQKHWIVFLVPGVLLLIALLFLSNQHMTSTIYGALHNIFQHTSLDPLFSRLPFILLGLAVIYVGLKQWLIYVTSEYVVTNKRVFMREGFFDRVVRDTRLSTISHVTIDQDLLAQALNYGTLAINNFGGTRDVFSLVARPNEFQRNVQAQLDQGK